MDESNSNLRKKRKIVIVEDNDNVAKLIARTLSEEGYETKLISYGSAAVFYALEHKDLLLVIEYELPDMTAMEVVHNLKNGSDDIPFIIMSSPGNEKIIIEMMKAGARDYLVKEQGFLDLLPSSIERVLHQLEVEERLVSTEKNLRRSEDKFRNIFNSICDPIFIFDREGGILEYNVAVFKQLGYVEKDLNSLNIVDLHSETFKTGFNYYLEKMREEEQAVYETVVKGKDGKETPVECLSRAISYDNGQAFLTIMRDITERKKSESLLKRSEERLRRITSTMTDYIYTVFVEDSKPLKTVHSSACEIITGYTQDEFSENRYLWLEMVDEHDREMVLSNVRRILSGEQIKPYEHRIIRKDGRRAWLRNTPVLQYDEKGSLTAYDGVVQDITERKLTEEELLEQKAQLSAIVKAFDGLIYVCSSDYRIEFMNEKFIARTGYDPTGEKCYAALHDRVDICPWCVNDKVQKGQTVKWEVQSPKDNRWYSIVNTPIYHYDGRISKQSLTFDVSDTKYAEQEINRLNNLYFSLLEELSFPICRFQVDGAIISANASFFDHFVCSNKVPVKERNLFSCLPKTISAWTKDKLVLLNENRLQIKLNLTKMMPDDEILSNRIWCVIVILDDENRVMEYQGILTEKNSGNEKEGLVLNSG